MEIERLNELFSVCKVRDLKEVNLSDDFYFISKTDEELSLVCRTEYVPGNTTDREDGWKAFRIVGILDFSLIGILAGISSVLAEQSIGIFVVSTYNTDYILTKEPDYERAASALLESGYTVR